MDEACVSGTIPSELKGTLFRNGPGLLEIYGKKLNQFFDGDGLVYSTTFPGDGSVKFKHNFVGTKGFTEEQAALIRSARQRALRRGRPGRRCGISLRTRVFA